MSETNEKQTTPELTSEDLGTINGGATSGDGSVYTDGNTTMGWDVKANKKI